MKKIEATVQANKINLISDAITGVVSGFTVIEGNGRGSGKRQNIRAERGTKTIRAEYNKVAIISTIVEDSIVEKICKIIEERTQKAISMFLKLHPDSKVMSASGGVASNEK